MRWPTARIVAIQFLVYTLGGIGAFAAWMMIQTGNEAMLNDFAGYYLTYHFHNWTNRLYLWGPVILVSAALAFIAMLLILRTDKVGGYLGIISYLIGLVVDILVANVMFVHLLVGLLIGWVLLAPLIFGWNDIFEQDIQ
jgi:hypothetical protein